MTVSYTVYISNPEIDTSTTSKSNSGSDILAIAGTVGGGGTLLCFILLFCVMFIWWKRQSHRSKDCLNSLGYTSMDVQGLYLWLQHFL